MKTNFLKRIALTTFVLSTTSLLAQSPAPDEDTGPITECRTGFDNATRTSSEQPGGAVNVGKIDDRSCYSDYSESVVNNVTWGVYNITDGSNHLGTSLQPRIERSLARSGEVGVGSYARFTGTVRILEVADAPGTGNDGTYMMQSKGKHTGGGGSADPAICLYLVKPVLGQDANGKTVQKSFKLYREQIKFRGGSGSEGRDIVFLTDMKRNEPIEVVLEVGFRQDPNDPTKRIHYSDATIGGKAFKWDIPQPERGTESGIRYGAYRVKGGRAQIRWANTKYDKKDVVYDPNPGQDLAPEVALTSPANNATFTLGEVITISANASDPNNNLEKVNFQINDAFLKSDPTSPFETTFTPTETGTYKVTARAIDKTNIRTDSTVTITVVSPSNAPEVSFTSPADGANFELGEVINFSADASISNGSIEKVNFFINDVMFRSDATAPYTSSYTPTEVGTYVVTARAIDAENNKVDTTITIQVNAPTNIPSGYFKIRNVATGQFLSKSTTGDQEVTISDDSSKSNTSWTFVTTEGFSNIDSKDSGILRATGSNFTGGAFKVVGTAKAAPSSDSDKIWKIHYNNVNDTYRIESGNKSSGRYLYQEEDGNITHISALESDNRSVWELVSSDDAILSTTDITKKSSKFEIYPNPAVEKFTISFSDDAVFANKSIEIYNLLGNVVYKSTSSQSNLVFNSSNFKSGLYLVKVTTKGGNILHSKLIID